MPYKSDKQRRFMHAKHPKIAEKWDAEIRAQKANDKAARKKPAKQKVTSQPGYKWKKGAFNRL